MIHSYVNQTKADASDLVKCVDGTALPLILEFFILGG